MIIYLNNKEVTKKYKDLKVLDILNEIKNNLEDEILSKILINDIEVNEEYIKENISEKESVKELKFITKTSEALIIETIEEASDYLPKLNSCIKHTVLLFRNGREEEANNEYQLIIDGLEWYTGVIIKITSLLEQKDLSEEIKNLINDMNKPLSDLMVAYNKEDYVLVADILEYEIAEYVETIIEFNEKLEINYNFYHI